VSSTIIVADPLELIAEGVKSWLSGEDDLAVIAHARTGNELLALLRERKPDLVLLEVSLPEMDGIDTMRTLRKAHPEQSVLAFSALTDIEYVNSMLIEGAVGYLVKACTREELLLSVRTALNGEHRQGLPLPGEATGW